MLLYDLEEDEEEEEEGQEEGPGLGDGAQDMDSEGGYQTPATSL